MKYLFAIIALTLLPAVTHAASSLQINFSYTNSTLTLSEPALKQSNNYISVFDFENQISNSVSPFTLLVSNWKNNELIREKFNAKLGNFSLVVPYYSNAKQLTVLDNSSQKTIIEKDLSYISTCNTNGICEFEKGETATDCLPDCGITNPKYSEQTKALLKTSGGIITDTKGKVVLKGNANSSATTWAIITVTILVLITTLIIIIRRRKYGR